MVFKRFQYFLAVFVGFLYGSLVAVVVIAGQDNAPSKGCMNNRLFVSIKTPLTRVEGGRAKHRFREASRTRYDRAQPIVSSSFEMLREIYALP